jgi:hypothetical protein
VAGSQASIAVPAEVYPNGYSGGASTQIPLDGSPDGLTRIA